MIIIQMFIRIFLILLFNFYQSLPKTNKKVNNVDK